MEFQIAALLGKFGADVLALGALVYGLTFLLKKTLLKKAPKKYVTFVPFLLGIAAYAIFTAIVNLSATQILRETQAVVQKGVATGGAATVIHVLYEQFIRGAASSDNVKEACVRDVLEGFFSEIPEGLAERIAGIPAGENMSEEIRKALTQQLICPKEPETTFLVTALEQILKYV